jgi:DNA-binding MarR family transcriptional regulator
MVAAPTPYSVESYTSDESVGYLVARVRASLFAAVDREMAPLGVSAAQFVILLNVAQQRASCAADLAREQSTDTGSMTRMIDRLVRKGLLRRARDAKDRRVVRLELTEAGRRLARRLPAVAVKVLNHHLRGFSGAEFEQLKSLLRRMLANAD